MSFSRLASALGVVLLAATANTHCSERCYWRATP